MASVLDTIKGALGSFGSKVQTAPPKNMDTEKTAKQLREEAKRRAEKNLKEK